MRDGGMGCGGRTHLIGVIPDAVTIAVALIGTQKALTYFRTRIYLRGFGTAKVRLGLAN